METHNWLAEHFEARRPHLRAVAYRMLGSLAEAEDAVQESWLRLSRADTSGVENLDGWLTTVVARVCLNLLDARYMKLDAGSEEQFLNMNSPVTEVGIWDVVKQLPKLKDFTIQTMFTHGRRDNTDEKSVVDWINVVRRAKPRSVQIYSVDRFPADKKITKVDRDLLEEIARALTEQTGIPAEVFG